MATRAPLEERFWSQVDRRDAGECWHWRGWRNRNGYGSIGRDGKKAATHRLSWEMANGSPVPAGMFVCHRCDNPSCVNPAHLWLGSPRENTRDMLAKGRGKKATATHCIRGHEFTPENTLVGARQRFCRKCSSIRGAKWCAKRNQQEQSA